MKNQLFRFFLVAIGNTASFIFVIVLLKYIGFGDVIANFFGYVVAIIQSFVLNRKWTLWAHLPHDTKWDANSYKNIYTFESLESVVGLLKILPDAFIKNCTQRYHRFLITCRDMSRNAATMHFYLFPNNQ